MEELILANEFAYVKVRKVKKGDKEYIRIESPKLGRSSELSVHALELVTALTVDHFAQFLETPFGPV